MTSVNSRKNKIKKKNWHQPQPLNNGVKTRNRIRTRHGFKEKRPFHSVGLNKFHFSQHVIIPLTPGSYFLFGQHHFVLPCPYIFHNWLMYMCIFSVVQHLRRGENKWKYAKFYNEENYFDHSSTECEANGRGAELSDCPGMDLKKSPLQKPFKIKAHQRLDNEGLVWTSMHTISNLCCFLFFTVRF